MIDNYGKEVQLFAKFCNPENGYPGDKEWALKKLKLNNFYEVENIIMGQSHTTIYLKNIEGAFNSVSFDFYLDNQPINIYETPQFNWYLFEESESN